jgi:hypothetical protein
MASNGLLCSSAAAARAFMATLAGPFFPFFFPLLFFFSPAAAAAAMGFVFAMAGNPGREGRGEWGRRQLGFMGVWETTPSNPQGAAQQKQRGVQGRPFCGLLGLLFCQGPCE